METRSPSKSASKQATVTHPLDGSPESAAPPGVDLPGVSTRTGSPDSLVIPQASPDPSSPSQGRSSQALASVVTQQLNLGAGNTTEPEAPEEEEEADDRSASERDGDLTDASSAGESISGDDRPVASTDYVDLRSKDICRIIFLGTLPDRSKARLVCGRSIRECAQHAKKRLAGKSRASPRWHIHTKGSQGKTIHGVMSAPSLTHEEYQALVAREVAEMQEIAKELGDDSDDEADDSVEARGSGTAAASAPVVNFEGVTTFHTPPRSALRGTSRRLPLSQDTVGTRPTDFSLPDTVAAQVSELVREELDRVRASEVLLTSSSSPRQQSQPPAPRASIPTSQNTVTIDDPSVVEELGKTQDEYAPAKTKKHGTRGRKDGPEFLGLLTDKDERVIRPESKDGSVLLAKGWKLKKCFTTQAEARAWLTADDDDPDDSEPSSSEPEDGDDSDGETSSGSDRAKSRSKRSKKKKKKKKKSKGRTSYRGADPSTGNSKKIHDFDIDGEEIDEALVPENLSSRKDQSAFVDAAVDVTALPGMFSSGTIDSFDEAQGVAAVATSMLATLSGKRAQLQDAQWKTLQKNSLGKPKKATDFLTFVQGVEESKSPAFEQQTSKIRSLMLRRLYDAFEITDYLEHGLLPTITSLTYDYFYGLLNSIRQLYYKHPDTPWEGGPAQTMADYHASELAKLRCYSADYRIFILKIYVYFRESSAKKFYHPSMTGALWSHVASLEAPRHADQPSPKNPSPAKCSMCKSREIHQAFGLEASKNVCPFNELTGLHLKNAIKEAFDALQSHPNGNHVELVSAIIKAHH
jgi:hypothetical protein